MLLKLPFAAMDCGQLEGVAAVVVAAAVDQKVEVEADHVVAVEAPVSMTVQQCRCRLQWLPNICRPPPFRLNPLAGTGRKSMKWELGVDQGESTRGGQHRILLMSPASMVALGLCQGSPTASALSALTPTVAP